MTHGFKSILAVAQIEFAAKLIEAADVGVIYGNGTGTRRFSWSIGAVCADVVVCCKIQFSWKPLSMKLFTGAPNRRLMSVHQCQTPEQLALIYTIAQCPIPWQRRKSASNACQCGVVAIAQLIEKPFNLLSGC
jgi:hypothetical protein